MILAIETSCDDTCAAVVTEDGRTRSNVIASQGLLHARYGGVVPEIASRHHLELVDAVTADALERAGAPARRRRHGRGHARPRADRGAAGGRVRRRRRSRPRARLPLVPVDHLHGHVRGQHARRRPDRAAVSCAWWPAAATRSSRAWTSRPAYEVLGQTLDDAAGEAFDKGARLLGLGYPGGPGGRPAGPRGRPEASTSRAARRASSTSASAA